jgi:hypothetical protein
MEWYTIVALIVVIPLILFPVAFIWFINVGGIYTVIRETRKRRVAQKRRIKEAQAVKEQVHM